MRMTGIRAAALAVMGATALIASTPQQNANVMPANQALTASAVSVGTVTTSRAVQLQGGLGSQAAGAVLGGLAGAALGQEVGGGTGKVVATGVGATAGAAAGLQAGRSIAGPPAIERTVRMDNG
jgi:outer membrane lipoprotein SlyB